MDYMVGLLEKLNWPSYIHKDISRWTSAKNFTEESILRKRFRETENVENKAISSRRRWSTEPNQNVEVLATCKDQSEESDISCNYVQWLFHVLWYDASTILSKLGVCKNSRDYNRWKSTSPAFDSRTAGITPSYFSRYFIQWRSTLLSK
jgi:hypothetical protein